MKEMRRSLFNHRVVNLWNSLPQKAAEAKSVDIFKAEIDRFLLNKELQMLENRGLHKKLEKLSGCSSI